MSFPGLPLTFPCHLLWTFPSLVSLILISTEFQGPDGRQNKSKDEPRPHELHYRQQRKFFNNRGEQGLCRVKLLKVGVRCCSHSYTLTNTSSKQTPLNSGSMLPSCKQSKHTQLELAPWSKGNWSLNYPSFLSDLFSPLSTSSLWAPNVLRLLSLSQENKHNAFIIGFHHYLSNTAHESGPSCLRCGQFQEIVDTSECIDPHPTKWEWLFLQPGLSWKL